MSEWMRSTDEINQGQEGTLGMDDRIGYSH